MTTKKIYACEHCGAQAPKWSGRCLECGAWGTMKEEIVDTHKTKTNIQSVGAEVWDLRNVSNDAMTRFVSGNPELDRVLGGGMITGSLILLGGDPGIGKSTLLSQVAMHVKDAVYVSGEESAPQVKARLNRLEGDMSSVKFIGETNVEKIITAFKTLKPKLAIIDSIQTIYSPELEAEPGSINQIRATAARFLEVAKSQNITIFIIGHITKDGQLSGPKTLEHIVDAVVYLEGDPGRGYSLLRVFKNRFGAVGEVGVLKMTDVGFVPAANEHALFFSADRGESLPGSAVGCVLEGSRPFLADVQGLVTKTVFGYPQRKTSGFDLNRLQVLCAVLSKRQKLNLGNQDVILNIVGGFKINDPALDLAVCAVLASSYFNIPLNPKAVFIGEVGLNGEVRPTFKAEMRIKEAERMGMEKIYLSSLNANIKTKLKLISTDNLPELIKQALGK